MPAQQIDSAAITRNVDAAVKARIDGIAEYTATERYAVFRNGDETRPVAEMTVKTTYKRKVARDTRSFPRAALTLIRSLVLHAILENEQHVNEPGVREGAWIYDGQLRNAS